MEKVILKAEIRPTGRHANRELRNVKRVPAVVYGHDMSAQPVSLDAKTLGLVLHRSGGGVIEMELPDQPSLHVLVREVQRHPTRHNVQHVDFLAVSMTEKVRVHVSVVHEGQAPILTNQDMVLVRNVDSVEVECLPGDIPEHLVADLSTLMTEDAEVLVKDLKVAANVKVLTDGNHVVFAVTASRAAALADEAAQAEAPSAGEVEVVAKRKPKEEVEEEKK